MLTDILFKIAYPMPQAAAWPPVLRFQPGNGQIASFYALQPVEFTEIVTSMQPAQTKRPTDLSIWQLHAP